MEPGVGALNSYEAGQTEHANQSSFIRRIGSSENDDAVLD